mmetsp:Transcript_53477/g.174027  ORF Transcript_53477/g.174027 Transcript_53477/m.174027 type:complete len:208 (-) Transcript_53477:2796-3419(-)
MFALLVGHLHTAGLRCQTSRHHSPLQTGIQPQARLQPLDVGHEGHGQVLYTTLVRKALQSLGDQVVVEVVDGGQRSLLLGDVRLRSWQAERPANQARRLVTLILCDACAHEDGIGAALRANTLLEHVAEGGHAPLQLAVGDTRLNEVAVNVDIRAEPVLRRDLLDEAERTVQLAAAVHELHQEGKSEVAGCNTLFFHAAEQTKAFIH